MLMGSPGLSRDGLLRAAAPVNGDFRRAAGAAAQRGRVSGEGG
ncbi:hypothetical protein APASM_5276 [Actinosynnema pretiosum subsp. pretiosum]|nr:hypothetical protein APASM_5276 [Actinosynnema pretiosum subsp. pretiosum]